MLMTYPGASVYLFCHIFHDWPDSSSRRILESTIASMARKDSHLVIVDQILPESGVPSFYAMMDLTMITFGGMERTEKQWRSLIESSSLNITRIEGPEPGSLSRDSLIETALEE